MKANICSLRKIGGLMDTLPRGFVASASWQDNGTVTRTEYFVRIWRRSDRRKADDLARLLLSLERLAGESRSWRPREQASVGIRW
jgi:hypothetical protein